MSEEVSTAQFEKLLIVFGAMLLILAIVLAGPAASILGMDDNEDTEQTPTEIDVQGAETAEAPDSTQEPPTLTPEPERPEDMTNREMLDYYVKGLDDEGTISVIDYTVTEEFVWLEYHHDYDNEYEQQLHVAAWYSVFAADVLSNDEPWDRAFIRMVSYEDGEVVSSYEIRTVHAVAYYQDEITAEEYISHVRSSLIYPEKTPTPSQTENFDTKTSYSPTPTPTPTSDDDGFSFKSTPTPTSDDEFEYPGGDGDEETPTPTATREPTPTPTPTPTPESTPTHTATSTPTPTDAGPTPTSTSEPEKASTSNSTSDSTPTPTSTPMKA